MADSDICRRLGIANPVFNAGMGAGIAGPDLVAAVANAGGGGVLGMGGLSPDYIRRQIRQTRELTDKPFGVNLLLSTLEDGQVEVCLEEQVDWLVLFWGDPGPYIARAHEQGVAVCVQVGSVEEARQAASAGADAIIAQGVEAGGHIKGEVALSVLLPAVVAAVAPVPVLASGGIADAAGLRAAQALGAQGVSMGTRFLASHEAHIDAEYKQRLIPARAADTVRTQLFDVGWSAPHRILRNRPYEEWVNAGRPATGERPGEGQIFGRMPIGDDTVDMVRYMFFAPMPGFKGDIEEAALHAGQSVECVHDIRPAGDIVRDMMA